MRAYEVVAPDCDVARETSGPGVGRVIEKG